jgi:flagellar hook-basal body complex protein FliE
LNHIDAITRLLKSIGAVIGNVQQSGGVGTPQQVQGLMLAEQFTGQHIAILAQDKNEAQRVKKFSDMLGKMMNLVKAFAQRQQEAMKAQSQNGGGDPEIAKDLIKAKTKAQISTATAMQKLKHKDTSFVSDQRRKDVQTQAQIQRDNSKAIAETFQNGVKTGARKSPMVE